MKYLFILLIFLSSCYKEKLIEPKPQKCGVVQDWYTGVIGTRPYYTFVVKWNDGTYSNVDVPYSVFIKVNNGDSYCSRFY